VGDIGHSIVEFALGIPVDSDIAIQNESQQNQTKPYRPFLFEFPFLSFFHKVEGFCEKHTNGICL